MEIFRNTVGFQHKTAHYKKRLREVVLLCSLKPLGYLHALSLVVHHRLHLLLLVHHVLEQHGADAHLLGRVLGRPVLRAAGARGVGGRVLRGCAAIRRVLDGGFVLLRLVKRLGSILRIGGGADGLVGRERGGVRRGASRGPLRGGPEARRRQVAHLNALRRLPRVHELGVEHVVDVGVVAQQPRRVVVPILLLVQLVVVIQVQLVLGEAAPGEVRRSVFVARLQLGAEHSQVALVAVHAAHQALVLADETAHRVPRVRRARRRAEGLGGQVAGQLEHPGGPRGLAAGAVVGAGVVTVAERLGHLYLEWNGDGAT